MSSQNFKIRAVHSDICGIGYQLLRRKLFWWEHIEYAWLKYDPKAAERLKSIVTHLNGRLV